MIKIIKENLLTILISSAVILAVVSGYPDSSSTLVLGVLAIGLGHISDSRHKIIFGDKPTQSHEKEEVE